MKRGQEDIKKLYDDLEDSKKRLKELEEQDETGWEEFKISVSGKEVNMPLVRNHISYYGEKIKKLNASGLSRWL